MKLFISIMTLLLLNSSCQTRIKYNISDAYTGPCVVFIYQNNILTGDNVEITMDGLGRINRNNINDKFVFRSVETENEIQVVEVGQEVSENKNGRYVFRLFKNTSSSKCDDNELKTVTFFVGRESDYLNWLDKYSSELDYFDSVGVKWCKYYKDLEDK